MTRENSKKAEATRARILEVALNVFRERGFEQTTMREIASSAGVAVGAAYYYFPSKDAIILAFYEHAQDEMRVAITEALSLSKTFEQRIRSIVTCKLTYFAEYRKLLGALSAHVDPEHPVSPFSGESKAIREKDLSFFRGAVEASKLKLPSNIKIYLPRLLWLYQMGVLLFWVYDESAEQSRTSVLFEKSLKLLSLGLRLSGLPLFRPVHKLTAELLSAVYE